MTCRRLARVRACKDALPGKPVTAYVFAQGAACFLLPLRGCGLSRRSAPRNDNGGDVLAPAGTLPRSAHLARQTSLHPRTRPSFCMSLRTSAHTGAAIRVPAGKLGKLALLQANPQHLSYSPEVLLSVAPCRREYGLSRRFAPRNDMQKIAACPRLPVGTAGKRSFCAVRPWWYGILPLCGASSDWDLLLQQVPGTASPASPACPG